MASASETGHSKNVANFKQLITVISSFNKNYQPMADILQINNLEKQANNAEEALNKLKEAETLEKQAIAVLQAEFKSLNTLSSQLMGLLISSGAKSSSIEQARAVQKQIVGSNNKKKKVTNTSDNITEVKEVRSTSRQSYDSKLDNFEKMVMILQNITEYQPKEIEFQTNTLQDKIKAMKNAIKESDSKEVMRRQMMNERNTLLYAEDTGIVSIASKIKEYIKAIFGGAKSMEYKSVSKIAIKGINK